MAIENMLERNVFDAAMKTATKPTAAETRRRLVDGAGEIERLRRANEIMSAKLEMVDLFALVLNTRPAYPLVGAGEDVAAALRSHAEGL